MTAMGRWIDGLARYWSLSSRFGFPFCLDSSAEPTVRFRALARTGRYCSRSLPVRALAMVAMTLGWPIGALVEAWREAGRIQEDWPAASLQDRFRTFSDAYGLALGHSVPPLEYRLYRFFERGPRKEFRDYIYWVDLPALSVLNARSGANNQDVQDKQRFADICERHGLPHVPSLALFVGGRQMRPEKPFIPEQPDLWVKSLHGKGGQGASRWVKQAEGYRDAGGSVVAAEHFARQCAASDCLVQPFLRNHAELAPLTNGALACLRIVTGMTRGGTSELVTCALVLPRGDRLCSTGGITCSVDPNAGIVLRALSRGPGSRVVTRHPDTDKPLAGFVVPYWLESVDLTLRAHRVAFPRFVFLGWDVALTPAGPLLLETNSGWGALFHQCLDGPIGRTAFSRIVAQHL